MSDEYLRAPEPAPEHLAAVYAYTLSSDLYRGANRALREADLAALETWLPFVRHLCRALEAIRAAAPGPAPDPAAPPRPAVLVRNEWVFRGVVTCVRTAIPNYRIGSIVQWLAFSSASRKWKVAKWFAGQGGGGLVFAILAHAGIGIDRWSDYPEEAEVLFPPGTRFRVQRLCRLHQNTLEYPPTRDYAQFRLSEEDARAAGSVLVELEELADPAPS